MAKTVAYLGIPGSYSFIAAKKYFGKNATMLGQNTFADIFKAVTYRQAEAGIIPLENSITGSIYEAYDLLDQSGLKIIGEVILKIRHCLLGKKLTVQTETITKCFSHPEAIKQCRSFFEECKQIKVVFTSDTASAAKQLQEEGNLDSGTIGSSETARIYHLKILKQNLADNPNNYTRFVIVAKKETGCGNKVSLIFSVKHIPGSLVKALEPYAKHHLNLTKIESRPVVGKPWEYVFFVDLEVYGKEKALALLIKEMKDRVNFIRILGRYQKGLTYES